MPFMIGREPIRRTVKYLMAGRLYLNNSIQVFSVNYNTHGDHHNGAREFVFWYLPQVTYKNPNVQVITFKNMTPTPFIRCYYDDGRTMLVDIDSRDKNEILNHLIRVVGKSQEAIKNEEKDMHNLNSPANFGVGCANSCMCTIPGQVPCPGVVPLPNHMRGKFKKAQE